jgi:nitrogen-specific signal transduction histidine kinase
MTLKELTLMEQLRGAILTEQEEQLIKMIAAGCLHEVGNPLASIKGFIQLIKEQDELSPSLYLDMIYHEILKLELFLNQLRTAALPQLLMEQSYQLKQLMGLITQFLERQGTLFNIYIHESLPSELSISGSLDSVLQACQHIFLYLFEYSVDGEHLHIELTSKEAYLYIRLHNKKANKENENGQILNVNSPVFTEINMKEEGFGILLAYILVSQQGGSLRLYKSNETNRVELLLPLNKLTTTASSKLNFKF